MERLTPEQAIKMLRKEGMEVSPEQAAKILDFLYNLSHIVVAQYLRKQDQADQNIPKTVVNQKERIR